MLQARQHIHGIGNQLEAFTKMYTLEQLDAVRALHRTASNAQKAKQMELIDAQRCPLTESSNAAPADKVSHVTVRSSRVHCRMHEHRVPSWMLTL